MDLSDLPDCSLAKLLHMVMENTDLLENLPANTYSDDSWVQITKQLNNIPEFILLGKSSLGFYTFPSLTALG